MTERDWERFLDTKNIRYELLAIDDDTDEVIARATSYIDVDDVVSESEHIADQVDEHLHDEFNEEQDFDSMAKQALLESRA